MRRFTTNYSKLKYEGAKLSVKTKEQVVTIVDNPKTLTSSEPIRWRYGAYKGVSLFDRASLVDEWKSTRGRDLDSWSIEESGFNIFKQPERFDKLLEIIGNEYDVIICTPTHFKSNHDFYDAICQNIKCELILTEEFRYSTIDEVHSNIDCDKLIADRSEDDLTELAWLLWRGSYSAYGDDYILFQPSNVDHRYRKYLKHEVSKNYKYCDLLNVIENKRVLILDDTILTDCVFSALEISASIQALFTIYRPKSATIATLFAPLRRKQEIFEIPLQPKTAEPASEEFDPECYEEDELGYRTYTATKIDSDDDVF